MDDDTINDAAQLYPQAGEVVEGKYEIQQVLGVGAMGCVIRAQHTLRKVPVALKFMSPKILGQPNIVERFLNEGVASSKIDSEHVVKVFDVSKLPSGVPYMVMEYLEGFDLADLLRREGVPYLEDVGRAIHITLQILRGLQAAHRVKIVHRDMKPANCFVIAKDGDPDFIKIVDFGISKIRETEANGGLELTNAGAALGTPLYMSLEQARSTKDVDARADLYSVAVILYELLAGVTPFIPLSGTLGELFTMLALEDPKRVEEQRKGLPPGLADVVHKGLHKDRDQRFQTAEQMAEALVRFADERSDYVLTRMLRTTGGARSRAAMSAHPPSAGVTGTVMMPSLPPSGLPQTTRREQMGSSRPPPTIHTTGSERVAGAQTGGVSGSNPALHAASSTSSATVREARVEEKKAGTPLVWAIAVVAVGAVAAAAWALGKVTAAPEKNVAQQTQLQDAKTAVEAPTPTSVTASASSTSSSSATVPPSAVSDSASATVASSSPSTKATTSGPIGTPKNSRPRLNDIGRD